MKKFSDIDLVRQVLKDAMPLNELMVLADAKYQQQNGIKLNPLEYVNDHLYKKKCDLDSHPMDDDGTRDSTASFTVCPQKELWHCFGCGEHGDRFEYISIRFNLTHVEAIELAAELEGVDINQYYEVLSAEEQARVALFNENNIARDLAHKELLNSKMALDYLHGRGITDESIEMFKIGYAPQINGSITLFNSVPNSITLQLDRRHQFNDAILFPINDSTGRMRYFQSRPFNPQPGMKYIGGDDSHPLFDETDRIYGFDVARRKLAKSGGKVVGVEGAPDTIACVQQGINTIGFMGTTMNQNTFDLLDKHRVNELTMLLDGDKAGRDKSIKNAEKYLTLKTKVRLKIAVLPEGYDPDEYINKFGVGELNKILDNAVYAIQYIIDSKWNGATSPTAKIDFMNSISQYILLVDDKITKQVMISYIASLLNLDVIQVEDYFAQAVVESNGSKLYSVEGEEILLGKALRDIDFMTDLMVHFKADDWYLSRHKKLFKLLMTADHCNNDIDSIFTMVKNANLDEVIQYSWLKYLYDKDGNVEFSIFDVEDKLIRRKSIEIIEKAKTQLNDMEYDSVSVIDGSLSNVYNIIHNQMDERIFDPTAQVNNVMELIHERMKDPGKIIGYSFGPGFPKLDAATLGLMTKSLTIISANQSVGKTQLAENFAMSQAINDNIPILWFSLEMDSDRMTFRNLSILSGVECKRMMTGNIDVSEKQLIDDSAVKLYNAPFYLSERGNDLAEALAITRRYVMKYGVKIVYVDYLQLQYVADRKTDARHRELGWISKAWKQLGKELDISIVGISQLSKTAIDAEIARAEHAAGSYEIAQDADNFITLKNKSEEEMEKRGIQHGQATMNLDKNRMGEREVLIDIYKDPPNYRMVECSESSN